MFRLMQSIVQQWRNLEMQIVELEEEIARVAQADPACQRLQTVPGVGPLAATAIVAAVGNGGPLEKAESSLRGLDSCLTNARRWPDEAARNQQARQRISSKTVYTRRSLRLLHVNRERHAWGGWITELKDRKPSNVATVAMANKLARIAWSVLYRNEVYRSHGSVVPATA